MAVDRNAKIVLQAGVVLCDRQVPAYEPAGIENFHKLFKRAK